MSLITRVEVLERALEAAQRDLEQTQAHRDQMMDERNELRRRLQAIGRFASNEPASERLT